MSEEVQEEEIIEKPVVYDKVKKIKDLTKEEEEDIVAKAKEGIQDPHYNVKFFKNGTHKLTLKKSAEKKESVAQKAIKEKGSSMTNDQLLMEHVIELTSQLEKVRGKQKKLKKKYKKMKMDIYTYDDASNGVKEVEPEPPKIAEEVKPVEEIKVVEEPKSDNSSRLGWRALVRV